MGYKFKQHERISDGIRRIAGEQSLIIHRQLKHSHADGHSESVHNVRICVKRLRALLRLVRDGLGAKFYHRENDALRTIAQSLSSARDVEVQLVTLQKLRREHPREISAKEFSILQNALLSRHEKQSGRMAASAAQVKTSLRSALLGFDEGPLKGLRKRDLRSGVRLCHRRFVKAYKQARRLPTDQNLHEWRKRTKDWYYQSCMMKRISPESVGEVTGRLKQLGDCLGDLHDLAMLKWQIEKNGSHRFDKLQKLIGDERDELRQAAFKSGRRLA